MTACQRLLNHAKCCGERQGIQWGWWCSARIVTHPASSSPFLERSREATCSSPFCSKGRVAVGVSVGVGSFALERALRPREKSKLATSSCTCLQLAGRRTLAIEPMHK